MVEDEVDDARSADVTRRAILSAAVAASPGPLLGEGAKAAESSDSDEAIDPALLAWRDWHEAHQLRERLWSEGQQLAAAADNTGRAASGADDADRLDEDLAAREDALAGDLFAAPAATILGVIAKLDALLVLMEPGPEREDEPWPQIRAVLADLGRLEVADAALRR